jgi:hypothetical protein
MFFYEGCKIIGQLDPKLIEEAQKFATSVDYKESRFTRPEPALKRSNTLISVPLPIGAPITGSQFGPAWPQDVSDLDFTSIKNILDELMKMPTFTNMELFACEVSYLFPHSALGEHTDVRFYHLCGRRIQIPLLVENACFISRRREFKLETPNVYEIDNITPHLARNDADTPKISLLIDVMDSSMMNEERQLGRYPRRRVLYFNSNPDTDYYGRGETVKK